MFLCHKEEIRYYFSMDSLTQFVLGAAIGHVVLGRHMGAGKAMLIGGLAGTIPDLDVIPLAFTDLVTSLNHHRGLSHSLLFCFVAPLAFAKVQIHFWHKKYPKITFWRWYWLWFLGFLTHILIDACTTWGTQIFWPLPYRISFNSVFIIDPIYTLPLIGALGLSLYRHHTKPRFIRTASLSATVIGLAFSTAYLLWGGIAKYQVNQAFEKAFVSQNIPVIRYMTRPTPFNTVLWALTAETKEGYITGYYSLLDTQDIRFSAPIPKNHTQLEPYKKNPQMQTLLYITDGYYHVEKQEDYIQIHDLRFGDFGSWNGEPGQSVFVYLFDTQTNTFTQAPRNISSPAKLLPGLWERIKGN